MFTYTDLTIASFKHILNCRTKFMGISNSMRILYNTFLLTKSGFLEVYD
jgi:hypothetical protein